MSEPAAFSPTASLKFGWTTTLANLQPLLLIAGAGALLAILNGALGNSALASLVRLGVQALQAGVMLALIRAALRLTDGLKPEPPLLKSPLPLYFTFLLAQVLVGLLIAAGIILLIVPGLYWAVQFGFTGFVVADEKRDPVQAMRESSHLTRGVKWQLFVFGLLLLGVNLLGALALGIGLLITLPTSVIAAAQVFRKLQARASVTAAVPPAPIPAAA